MKLKYYLRGLGIGIMVTTVIMSFIRQPEELTDTQIKARARELGMIEENVLADLKKEEVSFEKYAGEGQIALGIVGKGKAYGKVGANALLLLKTTVMSVKLHVLNGNSSHSSVFK